MTTIQSITADNLPADSGIIIDVRTPAEHVEKHLVQPHVLVLLDQLDVAQFMASNNVSDDQTVYILCRSGKRAVTAAQMFIGAGFLNVQVIEGGILACEANDIAVE